MKLAPNSTYDVKDALNFIKENKEKLNYIFSFDNKLNVSDTEISITVVDETILIATFSGEEITFIRDDVTISTNENNILLVDIANLENNITCYEFFVDGYSIFRPEVEKLYEEVKSDLYLNAVLLNDKDIGVKTVVKDKEYNIIAVFDPAAYDDDPGEIAFTVLDVLNVKSINDSYKSVEYIISNGNTNTLTLAYK